MPSRFKPVFEFITPVFAGFVRPMGHLHGLVLTHATDGTPLTRLGGCFFNVEHYTATGRCGLFVPRDDVEHHYTVGDDWIMLDFGPVPEWPVDGAVRYTLRADDTIDVAWTFHFHEALSNFEVFVASYMPPGTPAPFMRRGGVWERPVIEPDIREQLFVPRDARAAALHRDGRWDILFDRGYASRVADETYDLPVMVTTGPAGVAAPMLIQLIEPGYCVALSPNLFAPAHDLSLVGTDVERGTEISVRGRLIYRRLSRIDDVEVLYQEFIDSVGGDRIIRPS